MIKSLFARHEGRKMSTTYDLKNDDILDPDYQTLIHNDRAVVVACIRECWSHKASIQEMPYRKVLVITEPDESSISV